jgi:hypothetical protein
VGCTTLVYISWRTLVAKTWENLGQRVLIRNGKPAGTPCVRRRPAPRRLTAVSAVCTHRGRPKSGGPCAMSGLPYAWREKAPGRRHAATPAHRWTPPPYAIGSTPTRTSPPTISHTATLQGLDTRKPPSPTCQAIKTRPPFPLAHRSRATAELPPRQWRRTASSTLRPLAPPTHVAPAWPRIPSSSHFRLLLRPSHQLAGAEFSAAAAAGLRHTRLPVASPPWVSTQVGSPQLVDPPQPLPRPRPPARSPESGRPRRPLALDYIAYSDFFPRV